MVKFFACAHFGWSESVSYKRLEDIPSASIDLEQPWKIQPDLERPPEELLASLHQQPLLDSGLRRLSKG